jgi:hypothetical protein
VTEETRVANRNRLTASKNQREREKRAKQQQKAEQRRLRQAQRAENPRDRSSGEDPDIAGIKPGPQPPQED